MSSIFVLIAKKHIPVLKHITSIFSILKKMPLSSPVFACAFLPISYSNITQGLSLNKLLLNLSSNVFTDVCVFLARSKLLNMYSLIVGKKNLYIPKFLSFSKNFGLYFLFFINPSMYFL